jgi:hypothetical protein
MLLLGLIALACESGLHFGAQVWSRAEANAGADDELTTSQTVLRNLLARALPRMKGDYVTFEGEPGEIRFDLVPPQAFEQGGTAHAVLRITNTPSGAVFVLDMRSITDPQTEKHTTLAAHAGLMRISYLDASGKGGTWLSYWRDKSRLPAAVRIEAADTKAWPALIVRPLIVESATCFLDPVSMTCRKI